MTKPSDFLYELGYAAGKADAWENVKTYKRDMAIIIALIILGYLWLASMHFGVCG